MPSHAPQDHRTLRSACEHLIRPSNPCLVAALLLLTPALAHDAVAAPPELRPESSPQVERPRENSRESTREERDDGARKPQGAPTPAPAPTSKPSDAEPKSPKAAAKDSHLKRTTNDAGGFSIAHEPAWQVRSEGASTVLMPTTTPADPANPEFYGVHAAAWSASKPLSDAVHAEEAARLLLADAPLLVRTGAIETIALGDAAKDAADSAENPRKSTAILVRASASAEGRTMRVVLLARNLGDALVGLVVLGDDATIAAREKVARTLLASVEKATPAPAAAAATAAIGAAERAFVGRWSCEEVLSSGGGFDFGGQASMVTERILELGGDGRFALGARSAGGGSGAVFEGGFRVDARGSWRIERAGELAYLVLAADGAGAERVRCAMHEGKLVLGEPGARKFFARID